VVTERGGREFEQVDRRGRGVMSNREARYVKTKRPRPRRIKRGKGGGVVDQG